MSRGRAADILRSAMSDPAASSPKSPIDRLLALALAAIVALVFARGLTGEFVYDDERQIVANTLIQNPALLGKALVSDVWAFNSAAGGSVSNYWRPAFVLWLFAQYQLFGGASTIPWHAANLILHAGAAVMVFFTLRRLGFTPILAFGAAAIFGVHPSRVESVTWISGSPDLLMAIGVLGGLIAVEAALERAWKPGWPVAVACYALAQLSKEAAIVFPAVVGAAVLARDAGLASKGATWRRAVLAALPFAVLGVLYLIGRAMVLGRAGARPVGGPGPVETILTAPSIALFYLRQAVWPAGLSPVYDVQVVHAGNLGLANFVLPLTVCAIIGAVLVKFVRRGGPAMLGLALLLLPLAPAFHIGAFREDQLVHDRYLYLPLAGVLMIALAALRGVNVRMAGGAAMVAAAACAAVTFFYIPAWTSNTRLWRRAVDAQPGCAFAWMQHGVYLKEDGRLQEARAAFDRARSIRPDPIIALGSAETAIALGEFDRAERELNELVELYSSAPGPIAGDGEAGARAGEWGYVLFPAYERLALCHQQQGRLDRAEAVLRTARERLPLRRATLTERIAVTLYLQGRKGEALAELEGARDAARREIAPASRMVLFRLGQLYLELGRADEANAALREFLDSTSGMSDPIIRAHRAAAETLLRGG